MKTQTVCQCPYEATHHRVGKCQEPGAYKVRRDGETLTVCGRCTLPDDENGHS